MFDMKKGDKGSDAGSREPQRFEPPRAESAGGRPSASASASAPREAAVIGPSIQIDGDLRGEEDLVIEGEVSGTVQLKTNSVTVGAQGKVRADVYAHSIYVDGYVEGDMFGSERVHIRKSAQVRGNITSPNVSLEDGAKFKGSIEMDPQAVTTALGIRQGSNASAKPAQAPSTKPGGGKGFDAKADGPSVAAGAN